MRALLSAAAAETRGSPLRRLQSIIKNLNEQVSNMDMLQTQLVWGSTANQFNFKLCMNKTEERSAGELQLKGSCRQQTHCHISAQLLSKVSKHTLTILGSCSVAMALPVQRQAVHMTFPVPEQMLQRSSPPLLAVALSALTATLPPPTQLPQVR